VDARGGARSFLGGTIRSIADEWMKKGRVSRRGGGDGGSRRDERTIRAERPIAEHEDFGDGGAGARGIESRIDLPRISRLLDDDELALEIMNAMMEGLQAREIKTACGIGDTDYESKRTKIRRRLHGSTEAEGLGE